MLHTAYFNYVIPRAKRSLCDAFAAMGLKIGGPAPGTSDEHLAEMKGHTGEIDEIEFPDGNDAPPYLEKLADACEAARTPYFTAVDAHLLDQRPDVKSRRALGYVLLNTTGAPEDRRRFVVPFEAGAVKRDLDTLLTVGLTEAEAVAVLTQFGLSVPSRMAA